MKRNLTRLLLSAVLMMCCMSAWAGGDWTILEQPTCSKYGTMRNPANTDELRLVPKLAHQFDSDGVCTVCGHTAPTMYNGTPATSLVTITEENYATYGLTEKNKDCVMGWKVITTAEEFMRYMDNDGSSFIRTNAFLAEDIILNKEDNLPSRSLNEGYAFNGTGHTISNIYVTSGGILVGLFNSNNGTIRNLGLISPKIKNELYGGCVCGRNEGLIENCFVIDGFIEEGNNGYGIATNNKGRTVNCYAITNIGNVGNENVTNSYGATTGNVPDDFYASTLSGLNANKANGITWYHSSVSYPVMMPSMTYHPAKPATCTEDGLIYNCWQCMVCGEYFLDANHTQATTLEALTSHALGHNMKHNVKVEATCVAPGSKEYYYCNRCEKDFDDEMGTNEIDDIVIPIDSNNHLLTLVNDKAHCEWCEHDFEDFVATDNKPILLTKKNDEYFLKADDGFVLDDGVNYLASVNFIVEGNFTYRRNVSAVKAGAWQCWYEPFDLQLDGDVLAKMDVAEVAGVLIDNEGNTVVAFRKIDTGWMKANTPYVFRPKDAILAVGSLELKMNSPELCRSDETTFYNMSTYDKFTFGGNYTARHNDSWYTLNASGVFQTMKENVNLKGQRFWMTVEARDDIPYECGGIADAKEFIDFTVLGDDKPTGIESLTSALSEGKGVIYDLMGRKVTSIHSGQVYIMDGKKYIAR